MDRNIVYPSSIPLDTDILSLNRSTMIGLGYLMQAVLGTNTVVDGLACTPTTPASMTVTVGPGMITQLSVIDQNTYGSLAADTDPLVKMGINIAPISFTLAAPTTSGQAMNYLIEAAFQESDASPVVLPYYNAANPSQPYSGPANSGVAQNTQRIQRVQFQLKNGAPATAGSQITPLVDSGWTGLYVITVGYGQTSITTQNNSISTLVTAPFLRWKLPTLVPGFGSGVQVFTASGTFQVPAGITQLDAEVWGGGAGSFASTSSSASGGGGGGGYARKRITGLVPGQAIAVVVGAGGTGGTTTGGAATGGQASSFGSYIAATGGTVNPSASTSNPQLGGGPGGGQNGDVNLFGSAGQSGFTGIGGMGGAAPMGGSQNSGTVGNAGINPGGGASGAGTGSSGSTPYAGAAGANGMVVVRY